MSQIQLTEEGYNKLKEELKILEENERPLVAKQLKEALSQGDISENAAYEEAQDKQSRLEGRIQEIKKVLASSILVKTSSGSELRIGSNLKVQTQDGKMRNFTITGSEEADPINGKISYDSPLGRALIGHKTNEVVKIITPSGEKSYTILEVH